MHPWIIIACIYSTQSVFSDVIDYTDIYFKFCRVADGGLFCSMLSYYDPSPLCFHSTVFWVFSFSFCTVTFCVFACLPSTWLIWWQCLQGSMDRLLYMKTCHILPQNWKEKIRMHILAQKKMKPLFYRTNKICIVTLHFKTKDSTTIATMMMKCTVYIIIFQIIVWLIFFCCKMRIKMKCPWQVSFFWVQTFFRWFQHWLSVFL